MAEAKSPLEIELDRLCNSLKHLERSNEELKAAMQEDVLAGRRPDQDFKQALQENIVTIAKHRARYGNLCYLLSMKLVGLASCTTSCNPCAMQTHKQPPC